MSLPDNVQLQTSQDQDLKDGLHSSSNKPSIEEFEVIRRKLEAETARFKEELEVLKADRETLMATFSKTLEELEVVKKTNAEKEALLSKFSEKQKIWKSTQAKLKSFQESNEEKQKMIENYEQKVNKLQEEVSLLQNSIVSLQKDHVQTIKQMKHFKGEAIGLKLRFDTLTSENKKLEDLCHKCKEEVERGCSENKQLLHRIQELEGKNLSSQELIVQLQEEARKTNTALKGTQLQLKKKMEQLAALEGIRVDLQEHVERLQVDLVQSSSALSNAEQTVHRQSVQFANELEKANQKITELQQQLDDFMSKDNSNEAPIIAKATEQEKMALERKIISLQEQIKQINDEMDSKEDEYQSTLLALNQKLTDSQKPTLEVSAPDEVPQEIPKKSNELSNTTHEEITSLKASLSDQTSLTSQLQNDISGLKEQIAKLVSENKKLKHYIHKNIKTTTTTTSISPSPEVQRVANTTNENNFAD